MPLAKKFSTEFAGVARITAEDNVTDVLVGDVTDSLRKFYLSADDQQAVGEDVASAWKGHAQQRFDESGGSPEDIRYVSACFEARSVLISGQEYFHPHCRRLR